jgi:GTP diphosphokinase / guanosine-3',5'-bis(diphosphate) 3'-diphosphatase
LAWLNYAATGRARSHIRHYLKTTQQSESVELGELLLIQAVRTLNFAPNDIGKLHWQRLLKGDSARSKEEVLAEIGLGKRLAIVAARRLFDVAELGQPEHKPKDAIVIRGTENMAVQFAACCRPIPGDPIIAAMKGGQGLIVHTHDCPTLRGYHANGTAKFDPDKWVDVSWDKAINKLFKVDIRMVVTDARGVLAKLAAEISSANSNIVHIRMDDVPRDEKFSTLQFTIEVSHRQHLAKILRQMRQLEEVVRITRVKSGQAKEAKSDAKTENKVNDIK